MSAVTKFVILCLNLQAITSGPVTNGSTLGVSWTSWIDNNTRANTIRLYNDVLEANGSDAGPADMYDSSSLSRIHAQTSTFYNATQKKLSFGTPKNASVDVDFDSVIFASHVPAPTETNRTVVVQLKKYENYKRISLRDSKYFPGILLRSGEADFDLVLVPPTKDHRIVVSISSLNLRVEPGPAIPSSLEFDTWRQFNVKRCRDYLQFKPDSNGFFFTDEKICGELSSYTTGTEKLIGRRQHIGQPGQNITVSLHRAGDSERDRRDGNMWTTSIFFRSNGDLNAAIQLGGVLSVSTFAFQDGGTIRDYSVSSPRDYRTTVPIIPEIPRFDFGEFQPTTPPPPIPFSRTESPFGVGDNKDSYPYLDSSPFHLMWWVILIIVVIFLNFFALICKRMREMDAQPRRSPANNRHTQRSTLRDSFIMPSQLLQRFTEQGQAGPGAPTRGLAARTRTIHTILGIAPPATMVAPPARSSSPPPIYPGPASDPYLPSYESLFDTKSVQVPVPLPQNTLTTTTTCTSPVNNNGSSVPESPGAEPNEQQQK